MTETPKERTLAEGVDRLNNLFEEQLHPNEIVLHNIPGGGYRLYLEPVNPSEAAEDFRSGIGEVFDKSEMDAFIRGLELSQAISQSSTNPPEGSNE